jgi:hypothetical protein
MTETKTKREPAKIFAKRIDCLMAFAESSRKMFEGKIGGETYWGLASTEHQFVVALIRHVTDIVRIPRAQ